MSIVHTTKIQISQTETEIQNATKIVHTTKIQISQTETEIQNATKNMA